MIELYAAGTPNGLKIAIALEWLGLPYTVIPIALRGDAPRPDAFVAASPLGKIPAIRDTETGISLAESGAILIYLAEKTGSPLLPSGNADRANVLAWHFIASSTIGPALGQAHHYLHFQKGKAPYAEERCAADVGRYYAALDSQLSKTVFLAGAEASIADLALWPWIVRYGWQGIDLADYRSVHRWYRRLAGEKAVLDGLEKLQGTRDIPMPSVTPGIVG